MYWKFLKKLVVNKEKFSKFRKKFEMENFGNNLRILTKFVLVSYEIIQNMKIIGNS